MIGYAVDLPGSIGWKRLSYQRPAKRMIPRIRFSKHAIERYIERVRPMLDESLARNELNTIVQRQPELCDPPWWMERKGRPGAIYFCPTDEVCFPLKLERGEYHAITCIAHIEHGAWW